MAMALLKTYAELPSRELKRRARDNDQLAKVLYRAAAYGTSLQVLLWLVVILTAAGSFVLLARLAPPILAFVAVAVAIGYGFAWMPTGRATEIGARVTTWMTPFLVWVLARVHPLLDWLIAVAQKYRPVTIHTGLYERDDLLKLIEAQKRQPDSRIPFETLELLAHALTFGDKLVSDCMVPRRMVRMVSADQAISPVIIRELHDSGFSRFPVYQDKPEHIVGTLYLRKLTSLKHTGLVREMMQQAVYYVHEEHPLEQVLDAFLKTQHHLFIVVNSFEEFVGIITIEDILEQILGCKIVDEFDQYDDLRAVAAHAAQKEHDAHKLEGEEVIKDLPEQKSIGKKDNTDTQEVIK